MRWNLTSSYWWKSAWRWAVIAGALVLLWFVCTRTIAGAIYRSNPLLAVYLTDSPTGLARIAAQTAFSNQRDPLTLQKAERWAHAAILKDPTAADAFAALGMIASARGNKELAAAEFNHAARLMKRNAIAHTWLGGYAAENGDSQAALDHLDIPLTTSDNARSALIPLLVRLATDPNAVPLLVKSVGRDPPWKNAFLTELATKGSPPENLHAIFLRLEQEGSKLSRPIAMRLVNHLAESRNFELAAIHYEAASGQKPDGILNGGFESKLGIPPFDWTFPGRSTGTGVEAKPEGRGKALRFEVGRRSPKVLAYQLLMLRPGEYVLQGTINMVTETPPAEWRIFCAGKTAMIGDAKAQTSVEQWIAFSGKISVPASCPAQWLRLVSESSSDIRSEGYYDNLAIRRVGDDAGHPRKSDSPK